MFRFFPILVSIDLFALCVPTQWLGPTLEMTLAIVLAVVTAGYWFVRWASG